MVCLLRDIPQLNDPLGETLYSLRLNGVLYANSDLSAPWAVEMPAMEGKMMFHIATSSRCLLQSNGQSLQLCPGELALVPRGNGQQILSEPDVTCAPFMEIPVTKISERFEQISYGEDGDKTNLICGVVSFGHLNGNHLISQLPSLIHVKANNDSTRNLAALLEVIADEAASLRVGGEAIIANLADVIVLKAIRYWIEQSPQAQMGWLGELRAPKIGAALVLVHSQPHLPWDVAGLAQKVAMSRSGFSARFSELVSQPVKQYLTHWRMSLARNKLSHESLSLTELSEQLGYQSEAAFSRAYKRVFGEPPLRSNNRSSTN